MRITRKHLEAKVGIVNSLLGYDSPEFNTVGSIQLYGAYGSHAVHQVITTGHAIADLSGLGTTRETAAFLSGIITALRMANDNG